MKHGKKQRFTKEAQIIPWLFILHPCIKMYYSATTAYLSLTGQGVIFAKELRSFSNVHTYKALFIIVGEREAKGGILTTMWGEG